MFQPAGPRYSSNDLGSTTNQLERLRLFHYLFWQEVFFGPRFDHGSS